MGHAVSHAVPVYPDEISPYTYQYAVADDYSGSRFDAQESDDGTAARQGHYSVNLPDGRIQHVNYHANDIDGYVAEVTYDGTAAFPTALLVSVMASPTVVLSVMASLKVVWLATVLESPTKEWLILVKNTTQDNRPTYLSFCQ